MSRRGSLTMSLLLCLMWTQLLLTESSSGDHELRLFPSRRSSRLPPPLHPRHDLNSQHDVDNLPESHPHHHHHLHHLHHHQHHQHPARLAKVMPAAHLDSRFRQEPVGQQTLNLLARPHHKVQPEHAVVSARHLVTVVSNPLTDGDVGELFSVYFKRRLLCLFGPHFEDSLCV
ncbi:lateral signaling target protein 2 homolog [Larimichthys crocea]|uniref:lateral signaling target protein 2 homolog n=1 Tax=Larimichthys crocea TaxID=215358 RepID=UPI000F5EF0A1|nr:lateral signaling target protein 2 homolog [Larimichthys crocea]